MLDVSGAELGVTLSSGYRCFEIFGAADVNTAGAEWTNTLLEWLNDTADGPRNLVVQAGSQFGPYAVTVHILDDEPPAPDPAWEDVSEISILCEDQVAIGDLEDGPDHFITLVPGTQRLRVSARGRTESAERENTFPDDDADESQDEALEHFLLELWPAAAEPPVVIRENSQYARDTLNPPTPQWPVERDPGLDAARSVAADLRNEPGSRTLSGRVGDVRVSMEVADTPTRMFNRVRYANGWPPSNGGMLSFNENVGDKAAHYADPPDTDWLTLLGMIETEVIDIEKPTRFVMTWNWRVAGLDGAPHRTNPLLLEVDSTVTMTFERLNGKGQDPRTLIAIHHAGVPVEWISDLERLWLWDLAMASRR